VSFSATIADEQRRPSHWVPRILRMLDRFVPDLDDSPRGRIRNRRQEGRGKRLPGTMIRL